MALIFHDSDRFRFLGTDGRFHAVRPLSIDGLIELDDFLRILGNETNQQPEKQFESLYLENEVVRQCCYEIIKLCGISPDVVSADILVALLFRQEGSPYPKGIIHHLNRLDKSDADKNEKGSNSDNEAASLEVYRMKLCVALINVGLAENIDAAKHIVGTSPLPWIEDAIAFRADSLKSPEEKKKEKLDERIKEAQDRQTQQMQEKGLGSIFDGMKSGRMVTNPVEIMRMTGTKFTPSQSAPG